MLIQRRPGASTISTCGSSTRSAARAAAAAAVARAERRPKGERGRLGMARTERIIRRRHRADHSTSAARFRHPGRISWLRARRELRYPCLPHSWTHPEGWRDWPYETPPTCPARKRREKVAIPSGSKTTAWEMRCRVSGISEPRRRTRPGEEEEEQMPADALKCKECST